MTKGAPRGAPFGLGGMRTERTVEFQNDEDWT